MAVFYFQLLTRSKPGQYSPLIVAYVIWLHLHPAYLSEENTFGWLFDVFLDFEYVFFNHLSLVSSEGLHGRVKVAINEFHMRHINLTKIIRLVSLDNLSMLSKVHTEDNDLIVNHMDSSKTIKRLSLFTEVSVLDVDFGTFVSQEELLKSVEKPLDPLLDTSAHICEFAH